LQSFSLKKAIYWDVFQENILGSTYGLECLLYSNFEKCWACDLGLLS